MDVCHDEFALERLFFQQIDDLFGVGRGKSRGGLVEEEYGGFANQFEGDVQSFALSARDVFSDGRTYFQVFGSVEFEVFQRFDDSFVDFLLRHSFKTEFCRVVKVLIDGEFLDEQVVLRHESDEVSGLRFRDVVSVDGDSSFLRSERAVQNREQGRFSSTRTAHDGKKFAASEREIQVVHAVVAVGEAEIDVAPTKFDALRLAFPQS